MGISTVADERGMFIACLVEMDFSTGVKRWWPGFGPIVAGGYTWQGMGQVLTVSDIAQPLGTVAESLTITLSGVDAEVISAAQAADEVAYGRRVKVWSQVCRLEPAAGGLLWAQPDGDPEVEWIGYMDELTLASTTDPATGLRVDTATLTCETLWLWRNRAPNGNYTAVDQRRRFAGDAGCDQIAGLRQKTVTWV